MVDTRLIHDVRSLVNRGKDWLSSPDSTSIRLQWLPVSQCYAVMWMDQLLRIGEHDELMEYIGETFPE